MQWLNLLFSWVFVANLNYVPHIFELVEAIFFSIGIKTHHKESSRKTSGKQLCGDGKTFKTASEKIVIIIT